VQCCRGNQYIIGDAGVAARRAVYPSFLKNTNVRGVNVWVSWKVLESDAGNDFSAGMAYLKDEISYIKANYPGKQIMITMWISGYEHTDVAFQKTRLPNYAVDAGCVGLEGTYSFVPRIHDDTCRGYIKRLVQAYSSLLDGDPAIEAVRIDQETDYGYSTPAGQGWSASGVDAGWRDVAQAASAAYPHTTIWIPMNATETWTNDAMAAQIDYYKSVHVAIGAPDTCALSGPAATACGWIVGSTVGIGMPPALRGYGTTARHDYCGEIMVMQGVELSEMGYNSQPPHPSGLTSGQVVDAWNNDYCANYGIWDLNLNEIGDPTTQYWGGSSGQLATINAKPITRTGYPKNYP
jgi:hypothetical protein